MMLQITLTSNWCPLFCPTHDPLCPDTGEPALWSKLPLHPDQLHPSPQQRGLHHGCSQAEERVLPHQGCGTCSVADAFWFLCFARARKRSRKRFQDHCFKICRMLPTSVILCWLLLIIFLHSVGDPPGPWYDEWVFTETWTFWVLHSDARHRLKPGSLASASDATPEGEGGGQCCCVTARRGQTFRCPTRPCFCFCKINVFYGNFQTYTKNRENNIMHTQGPIAQLPRYQHLTIPRSLSPF